MDERIWVVDFYHIVAYFALSFLFSSSLFLHRMAFGRLYISVTVW